MPKSSTIELHFQEYFTGQTVTVSVGGREMATFTAATRMQIGLAHVETLNVEEGRSVSIRVSGAGEKTVPFVNGVTVYLVGLDDKKLSVEPARERPTYM